MRDFLLAQFTHPLVVLAQTYSRPVETLAAELGCSHLEAFQLQVKAAVELAPYVESRMPVAVNVDARGTIALTIHGLDGVQSVDEGTLIEGFALRGQMLDAVEEAVENQGVGE
jgi:hypothetical protein